MKKKSGNSHGGDESTTGEVSPSLSQRASLPGIDEDSKSRGSQGSGPEIEKKGLNLPKTNEAADAELEAAWKIKLKGFGKWELTRVQSVVPKCLKLYKRAVLGRASKAGAIKSHCQHCVGWSDLPAAVRDCTATACPLYAYRPYQKKKKVANG